MTADVGDAGNSAAYTNPNRLFTGNILDASNEENKFLGITGFSQFSSQALTFTLSSPATGSKTFIYKDFNANIKNGEFNNLRNLVTAINYTSGLSASVRDGRLYVGAENAEYPLTVTNGNGDEIDWSGELGITNVAAGENRFSNLKGLQELINKTSFR